MNDTKPDLKLGTYTIRFRMRTSEECMENYEWYKTVYSFTRWFQFRTRHKLKAQMRQWEMLAGILSAKVVLHDGSKDEAHR